MTLEHRIIWQEAKDYIWISLGLMLYTFGWTVFLLPYEIVTGGVTGMSAIIFYATKIPIEYSYFLNPLINLCTRLFSFLRLASSSASISARRLASSSSCSFLRRASSSAFFLISSV